NKMPYKYKKDRLKRNKLFWEKNKKRLSLERKEFYKKYPEKAILYHILQRCYNTNCKDFKNYGGRGILCDITEEEIKQLMMDYNYCKLKNPTIDRKNNDGNYTFDNCQFIENEINARKDKLIS